MSYYLSVISEAGSTPYIEAPIESLAIKDETIITLNSDTTVCSQFKSNQWDFSAISGDVKYFNFEIDLFSKEIIRDLKIMQYGRLYWSPTCKTISTLRMTTPNKLAAWADRNDISIEQMLNDVRLKHRILTSIEQLEQREANEIGTLIAELAAIRIAHPAFTLGPPDFSLSDQIRYSGAITKQTNRTNACNPHPPLRQPNS